MKTRISIVFLIFSLFLTVTPFSFAQTSQNDWSAVQRLAIGTDLLIKTSNGKTVNGSLATVNDNQVEISTKGSRLSLLKDNVGVIYLTASKSNKRGKTIGAVAGTLIGAAAGGAVNKDAVLESDYNYSAALLLAVAGGVGGYFVGGLFGKGKSKGALIYKAK